MISFGCVIQHVSFDWIADHSWCHCVLSPGNKHILPVFWRGSTWHRHYSDLARLCLSASFLKILVDFSLRPVRLCIIITAMIPSRYHWLRYDDLFRHHWRKMPRYLPQVPCLCLQGKDYRTKGSRCKVEGCGGAPTLSLKEKFRCLGKIRFTVSACFHKPVTFSLEKASYVTTRNSH
jgi:hypothetical protein